MILSLQQGLAQDGFKVSLVKLCQWFEMPRRTVYYRSTKAAPKVQDHFVKPIKAMIEENPSFGYRTVAHLLGFNKNTVQRIFQLKGWQVRKRPVGFRPRIQALPSVAKAPDERWATDLCRVWTGRDCWASLALVIDCYSRELLGWHLSRSGRSKTVLKIGVGFKRQPPVPIGTSHDLKVGQKVFAIGNPFGLDWTLTAGIVSALDRSLPNERGGPPIEHLIQTDASINPGNSGGPLLDSAGRLIGINTAIYSPSGASAGIGFAVPVDTVMRVVPQLIRTGRYIRPALGIEADETLNHRLVAATGIAGVFVLRVAPGSAAEKAGLTGVRMTSMGIEPGDAILAVEGKTVDSLPKLLARLDDLKVGDTVTLTVRRGNSTHEVAVTLQPGA